MEEGTLIVLIACGSFVAAFVAGAVLPRQSAKVLLAGVVLGSLTWLAVAIVIFRGPDNPDYGELGWTMLAAGIIGLFVGSWTVGTAAGAFLRAAVVRLRRSRSSEIPTEIHD